MHDCGVGLTVAGKHRAEVGEPKSGKRGGGDFHGSHRKKVS
jgi:hypothetical protein